MSDSKLYLFSGEDDYQASDLCFQILHLNIHLPFSTVCFSCDSFELAFNAL